MKKIFIILVSVVMFLAVTSCGKSRYYGNSIYYDAIEVGDVVVAKRPDGYYQMIKFTEAAYNKEVVVIPSHINGKPLIGIGSFGGLFVNRMFCCDYYGHEVLNGPFAQRSPFKQLNAKIIYIGAHHQNQRVLSKILASETLEKVVSTNCDNFDFYDKLNPTCFHSETAMSVVSIKEHDDDILANVWFYMNDSVNSVYWIDYEESDSLIFEPPAPYLEGHEFLGWYKEPECINKWDFNKDKFIVSSDVNIKLYAKWK